MSGFEDYQLYKEALAASGYSIIKTEELNNLVAANKRANEIIELIDAHDDSTSPFVEIAELKKKLEEAREYGNEWQHACQDRMREIEQLRAELSSRHTIVMTESEYKDYLSEQDRIKREAEEER